VVLPSFATTYVAAAPGGAHPSYAQGYSLRDNAFYTEWDAISKDRDTFLRWIDENVMREAPAA
jgi:glutaconate CoA-transferase subunit A